MPPLSRAQRNRAEKRDEVRHRLLIAAEEIMDEGGGFADIKVNQLAAHAGISRAGFYIHFQDKVELLEQWLTETSWTLFNRSSAWYGGDASFARPELERLLATILGVYRERATLMNAAREAALYDSVLREELAGSFEEHFAALTAHIAAAQATGFVVAEVVARPTAEWLVCMIERTATWLPQTVSLAELECQAAAAAGIVWSTLYEGAPARVEAGD